MGKKSREKRHRVGRLMGLTGWDDVQAQAYLKYAKVERRKLSTERTAVNTDPTKRMKRILAAPTFMPTFKKEDGGGHFIKDKKYFEAVDRYHKAALAIRKYLKPWKKDFLPI
jgi:hypothetical protein